MWHCFRCSHATSSFRAFPTCVVVGLGASLRPHLELGAEPSMGLDTRNQVDAAEGSVPGIAYVVMPSVASQFSMGL